MLQTDLHFDAASLRVSQRLSRWQELVGDHLADVDMRRPDDVAAKDAFCGSLSLRAYSDVTLARVSSANQLLYRTPERIRRAVRETALVTIVLSGECRVVQEGRRAILRAGDLCLYESVRPYEIATPGPFEGLVVMADRQAAEASIGDLRALTAIPIAASDAAGTIARNYWRDLGAHVAELDEATIAAMTRAGFAILGAALARSSDSSASCGVGSRLALQRAKSFMIQNLHRADLSLEEVARAAGVSLRRLQELFQADGSTASDHLRRLRLALARQRLSEAAFARHSIEFIMHSVGFSDPAHFSRAFRRVFGASPRSLRREARD